MKHMVLLAVSASWLAAADPAGFAQWKGAELKGYEAKLAPKMDARKIASEPLGSFGNHNLMIVHCEGNGEAEFHEKQADLFIVESGEATLVVGGTVVDPKNTAPNEIRGPSIKDGVSKRLGPGDIVHIPAKTPHQMMVSQRTPPRGLALGRQGSRQYRQPNSGPPVAEQHRLSLFGFSDDVSLFPPPCQSKSPCDSPQTSTPGTNYCTWEPCASALNQNQLRIVRVIGGFDAGGLREMPLERYYYVVPPPLGALAFPRRAGRGTLRTL